MSRIGALIDYVPDALRTDELWVISVIKDPRYISNAPIHILTQKVCDEVIENKTDALRYVPEAMRTAENCKIAVEKSFRDFS